MAALPGLTTTSLKGASGLAASPASFGTGAGRRCARSRPRPRTRELPGSRPSQRSSWAPEAERPRTGQRPGGRCEPPSSAYLLNALEDPKEQKQVATAHALFPQVPLLNVRCRKHSPSAFDLTLERFPNVGADECPIPRSPLGGPVAGQVHHHLTDANGGVLISVVKVSAGDGHILITARDGQ